MFCHRFTAVLEVAEDIEIDVPKIWQYLGEIVVPVIEDGTISLDILTKAPSSVIESGKAALLLAEVLKLSEKIMVSYSWKCFQVWNPAVFTQGPLSPQILLL